MTRFLWLALFGCATTTTSSTSTSPIGPNPPPALANTSIATAMPLSAGASFDLTLPCGVKAYFGPVKFATEGQRLALTTRVRSPSGKQVCGGGAFVDGGDVQQAVAGTGCIDGSHEHSANLEYPYTPGAGGPGANPIFLSAWTSDGTANPTGAECDALSLHVDVKAVP
jgi:hypothetical protein